MMIRVQWTEADDRQVYALADVMRSRTHHPSRPKPMPPVPVHVARRAPVFHALGIVLGFALALAGIVVALATPPLSGGILAGIALFGLGAATALRIASIHDRRIERDS